MLELEKALQLELTHQLEEEDHQVKECEGKMNRINESVIKNEHE